MAHIRTQTTQDAFFDQGFNAVRDRLWQIDLWRKRGLGILAADFGPGYLMQDRAARLFLYRGDMDGVWRGCADDLHGLCRWDQRWHRSGAGRCIAIAPRI